MAPVFSRVYNLRERRNYVNRRGFDFTRMPVELMQETMKLLPPRDIYALTKVSWAIRQLVLNPYGGVLRSFVKALDDEHIYPPRNKALPPLAWGYLLFEHVCTFCGVPTSSKRIVWSWSIRLCLDCLVQGANLPGRHWQSIDSMIMVPHLSLFNLMKKDKIILDGPEGLESTEDIVMKAFRRTGHYETLTKNSLPYKTLSWYQSETKRLTGLERVTFIVDFVEKLVEKAKIAERFSQWAWDRMLLDECDCDELWFHFSPSDFLDGISDSDGWSSESDLESSPDSDDDYME